MKRFQITEAEYEAIKAKESATKDKNISRRLRVLMLRYEGKKVEENHSDTFRMEVSFFGFLEHCAQGMAFQSGKRIFHMVICMS